MNYLSEKFMQALPEEDRAAIATELERKRLTDMENNWRNYGAQQCNPPPRKG